MGTPNLLSMDIHFRNPELQNRVQYFISYGMDGKLSEFSQRRSFLFERPYVAHYFHTDKNLGFAPTKLTGYRRIFQRGYVSLLRGFAPTSTKLTAYQGIFQRGYFSLLQGINLIPYYNERQRTYFIDKIGHRRINVYYHDNGDLDQIDYHNDNNNKRVLVKF